MSGLGAALAEVQAKLPLAVPRDSQGNGYRYTSLDKLIEASRSILNEHGISITQWVTTVPRGEDGLVPALRTRIERSTEDGTGADEFREDTMPLYLTDKTMQGLGAAITYARRYAWAAALGIASEEDTDAEVYERQADGVEF